MQDKIKQPTNKEYDERMQAKSRGFKLKNFGERYVDATLSQLEIDSRYAEVMVNFMKKPKGFLVYCGVTGVGKTHFCAALADWYIPKFNYVRYWKEDALLNRVRKSIGDYSHGDYNEELKYMLDDDFIILDDIGSCGYTDWREEILFSAIDFRYNSMKPTIITSNLLEDDFKKIYHPRIADRIFAKDNHVIQIMNGESKRR